MFFKISALKNFAVLRIKGTLIQIWKSAKIFIFIWKWYAQDFTLKRFLNFEISAREISEKFVYKYLETTEHVKNHPTLKKLTNFTGK